MDGQPLVPKAPGDAAPLVQLQRFVLRARRALLRTDTHAADDQREPTFLRVAPHFALNGTALQIGRALPVLGGWPARRIRARTDLEPVLDHLEERLHRARHDEGRAGGRRLALRELERALPLDLAESSVHHEQLADRDQVDQSDHHSLAVLAAAVVHHEQRALLDQVLDHANNLSCSIGRRDVLTDRLYCSNGTDFQIRQFAQRFTSVSSCSVQSSRTQYRFCSAFSFMIGCT